MSKKSQYLLAVTCILSLLFSGCLPKLPFGGPENPDKPAQISEKEEDKKDAIIKDESTPKEKQEQADSAKEQKEESNVSEEVDSYLNYDKNYRAVAKEYKSYYLEQLSRYYRLLTGQLEEDDLNQGMLGVFQAYTGQETVMDINEDTVGVLEEMEDSAEIGLASFGYNIIDISGDGVPELIIGGIDEKKGDYHYGKTIYEIYSIDEENEPYIALIGTSAEKLFYIGDGKFYYNYIGHPLDEFTAVMTLDTDARSVEYEDYYFMEEKGDDVKTPAFYRNIIGESDIDSSEELKISEQEYTALLASIRDKAKEIRLIPFSDFAEYSEMEFELTKIFADYSTEDEINFSFDYDSYNADDEEATKITFTSSERVKNFKILDLKYEEKGNTNEGSYVVEEVYGIDALDPNRPFIAGLHFLGLIPNNGISYTDAEGLTRTFMIYPSGKDDSLVLQEIK